MEEEEQEGGGGEVDPSEPRGQHHAQAQAVEDPQRQHDVSPFPMEEEARQEDTDSPSLLMKSDSSWKYQERMQDLIHRRSLIKHLEWQMNGGSLKLSRRVALEYLQGGRVGQVELVEEEELEGDRMILVVQGHKIPAHRGSLATVSNFFKALFKHQFRDSREPILCLDSSGEMGLTVQAIKVLTMFSETKKLEICGNTAIQIFIAADALDVAKVRVESETYLGQFILQKENFIPLWKMTRQFYMKILESFMDSLVLENFGWFSEHLSPKLYIKQWDIQKLSNALLQSRFKNCSEEQVFQAVISYCKWLGNQSQCLEMLAPGLYKSCNNYLRFLQSVPRTLTYRPFPPS